MTEDRTGVELTDDELAAQAAEPLPDREVMSVASPFDEALVAGEWVGGDADALDEPIPPADGQAARDPFPTERS